MVEQTLFDKIGICMVLISGQLQWVHSKIIIINQKLTYANPSVMVRSRDALSASQWWFRFGQLHVCWEKPCTSSKLSFPIQYFRDVIIACQYFVWSQSDEASRGHVLEVQMSLRYGFSYWPVKHQIQTKYQWSLEYKILDDKLCVPNRCYKSHMSRITWQGNSPKLETVMKIVIDKNHFCFEKSNWNKVYLSHEIIYQIKEIKFDRMNSFFFEEEIEFFTVKGTNHGKIASTSDGNFEVIATMALNWQSWLDENYESKQYLELCKELAK